MAAPFFFFDFGTVAKILSAMDQKKDEILLSLDLNLSRSIYRIETDRLILTPSVYISKTDLEAVASEKNKIFMLKGKGLQPLEVRSRAYYKLVSTSTAPILEINGIKMHRSKDIDPLRDAEDKTRAVVSKGDRVLDTCGGLGYSALFAVKAGAREVVSSEISPEVIQLRGLNPWLRGPETERISLVQADITRIIRELEDNRFESVIHDPPRFGTSTGDLYGKPFYESLYRVMASKSRLFHYTGTPKRITSSDRFIVNTIRRLEASGFGAVCFRPGLQGICAQKD